MENVKLREVWRIWKTAYDTSQDLAEKLVASDILEIIRDLITEKVTNACLKDATLNPDEVLREILTESGIPKRQFQA